MRVKREPAPRLLAKPKRRAGISAVAACLDVVARKAPRLIDPPYDRALLRLLVLPALRPLAEWVPRSKGRETLFRSLAEHLLARFPVPAVIWNAFHDEHATVFVPLAAHVAAGGSLHDLVQTRFAIPLTRRMCHDLLRTPSDTKLLIAVRRVQARAAGVSDRFFDTWRTTRYAQQIGSREDEAFWHSVVQWFAHAHVPSREIGPLLDYIDGRRREQATFSMKGRSGPATIHAMKAWHGALAAVKAEAPDTVFRSSGYEDAELLDSRLDRTGEEIHETWRIKEVLTARALAEEGTRMRHCVYSYAWRIERGDTSIWSVEMEDERSGGVAARMVTIEVRNDLRAVVQVRGRSNRRMSTKECRVVTKWAGLNGLQLARGA